MHTETNLEDKLQDYFRKVHRNLWMYTETKKKVNFVPEIKVLADRNL